MDVMTKQEQLKWAIEKWREAAAHAFPQAHKEACERTVQSLELELATSEPHCNCHMAPWDDCPSRIKTSVIL